ncbi:hypothetical protein C8R47DRAFT_1171798, partial [Mycena vitilis]
MLGGQFFIRLCCTPGGGSARPLLSVPAASPGEEVNDSMEDCVRGRRCAVAGHLLSSGISGISGNMRRVDLQSV